VGVAVDEWVEDVEVLVCDVEAEIGVPARTRRTPVF